MPETSFWAVCQTHPQAERWAQVNLTRCGYQSYLPLAAVRRRDRVLSSLWHTVLVPLFGNYLFVRMTARDSWTPIRYCPGVLRLILASHNSHPDRVPRGIVEAIQAGEAARLSPAAATSSWAPGAPCRLAAGPFANHDAVVLTVNLPASVASVGVIIFGAVRSLTVPLASLIPREEPR
jgi:transcriptional antiterminator RfaH